MDMSKKIEDVLKRLTHSNYRSQFKLDEKDEEYIRIRGFETIKKHTFDFVTRRISPAVIKNDGKQTPLQGHPVFKAQHATGTCCRKCLEKWHSIKSNKELSAKDIEYTGQVILAWLLGEYSKGSVDAKPSGKPKTMEKPHAA